MLRDDAFCCDFSLSSLPVRLLFVTSVIFSAGAIGIADAFDESLVPCCWGFRTTVGSVDGRFRFFAAVIPFEEVVDLSFFFIACFWLDLLSLFGFKFLRLTSFVDAECRSIVLPLLASDCLLLLVSSTRIISLRGRRIVPLSSTVSFCKEEYVSPP